MDTYYIFDNAKPVLDSIEQGIFPNYLIYGGWHLQNAGLAKIIDIKESNHVRDSQVVINVPLYASRFKARGNRVILINLNSNHILRKNNNFLVKWALKRIYNSCDIIMCLDKSQIEPLRKLGVKTKLVVNPLFVDTTDIERSIGQIKYGFKKYSPYYLSSGFDAGRNFSLYNQMDIIHPIVILSRMNPVPYTRYCKILAASKGMVLNITNSGGSSDLSGSTTVFEALCANKPVFINDQYWLKNFPSKNIYVYKTQEELEKLLNAGIEWQEETADFTFGQFFTKLKKVLRLK